MRLLLCVFGLVAITSTASAQFANPWGTNYGPNPWAGNSVPMGGYRGQLMGYMPNGTRIINPWAPQQIQPIIPAYIHNLQVQYSYSTLWNPSLYSPLPQWNTNPYSFNAAAAAAQVGMFPGIIPGINGGGAIAPPVTAPQSPILQQEVGRFVPVNRNVAVNPISGTVLDVRRGIALTREGPFYRVPGTGSITAWGAYIPGSGTYVNPFTGVAYDPVTGLIAR